MFYERLAAFLFAIGIGILLTLHLSVGYHVLREPSHIVLLSDLALVIMLVFWRLSDLVRFHQIKELQRKYERIEFALADRTQESQVLKLLRGLIEKSGEGKEIKEILRELVDSVHELFPQETVFLEVYSDEEMNLFTSLYRGEKRVDPGEVLREEVVLKTQYKLINNLETFPRYKYLAQQGVSSLMMTPLLKKGKGMGLLGVFTHRSYNFTPRELDLLSSVAVHASLIIENAQLMEKTKWLSITDGLTNIFNRRHFQTKLEEEMEKVRKYRKPLSLILGDLDNFKFYNDHNGHTAGDELLRKVAEILKENTKRQDTVARFGGEEFIIILPRTKKRDALKVAEDLRKKISDHVFPNEEIMPQKDVTITFGVSSYPEDGDTPEILIKKADERLYQGKAQGKNQVVG